MKAILSIPLIILILFTGISVKFATHYCGGYVAATKVSLTGELATCGMESKSDNNTQQKTFDKHCCDDITSAYSICNNYFASSYNFYDPGQQVINMIAVLAGYLSNQETIINTSNNDIRPPGTNHPNSVDRPVLCIFRI
ncbi:MAG: hypothetical protein Q8N38_02015 [Bacteroidales bacterium]|nr:hypothetical protein [Bacteroidales bacterium]